jgi:nucleoside phosphorylase
VLAAVEFEARHLTRRLALPSHTGRPETVLRTVGPAAAALPRLGGQLAALGPSAVLVVGLAGGCAPDVRSGDLVIGRLVGPTADGEWLAPDGALIERALGALQATGLRHHVGRLLTVPGVVAQPAAKAGCWQRQGALAVDMESAHVLAWARQAGFPAVAVRAVGDGPDEPLPVDLLHAIDATGALRSSAVLGWVGRPTLLGAAYRVWRRSRRALDHLARFLAAYSALRP